jgi:hypothetical protein
MAGEAGYNISVDWSNFDRLAGTLEGVHNRVAQLLAIDLEGNIRREAPVGITGNLHASWRSMMRTLGVWVVGSYLAYAAFVNDGTRPHIPPVAPIREWAEFRGLPWWPVWYSITQRGTKANPYIERSMDLTNKRMPLLINQAIAEVGIT